MFSEDKKMFSKILALEETVEAAASVDVLAIILGVILMVLAVVIVTATVLQSEKDKGLSGVISGSSSDDTFSPKSKTRTRDKVLSKVTLFGSIALAVVAIIMYVYVS